MCVTLSLPMVAKSAYWQGGWHETQDQLHDVAALLGGPLAVAAGCWHGGRERRTRMAELRACGARGPLAQFLVAALPVLLGVLVGYLVVVAGALLASWPYVSAGRPLAGPPAADAVYLAAMATVGMVGGRLLRWRLAAPALAVCAYVVIGVWSRQTSAFGFLDPAASGNVDELPVWWQPWVMAAWLAGLVSAVVVGYAVRRHRYLAVLPLAVAVAAAVPLMGCGGDMWHTDPLRKTSVCDDASPRVCVDALNSDLLPAVSHALSGITGRLDGVPHAPVRFRDPPRPGHHEARLPELYLGQSVVRGELVDPEAFAWEAGAGLTGIECARFSPTDDAVLDWLVSNRLSEQRREAGAEAARKSGDPAMVKDAEAETRGLARLRAMDDDERHAWLGRYFASLDDCEKGEVPTL